MNQKKKLIELISKYPDLPLVFFAQNDDFCDEYGSTVFESYNIYIAEIYEDGEQWYSDKEDILDKYMDRFADEEEYKNLTDKDYEKAIEEWINNNIKHYKAIVVSIGH